MFTLSVTDGRGERLAAGVAGFHRHPTLGRYHPQDGALGVPQLHAEQLLGELHRVAETVVGSHQKCPPRRFIRPLSHN